MSLFEHRLDLSLEMSMRQDESQIRELIAQCIAPPRAMMSTPCSGMIAEDARFYVAGAAPIVGRASFERNLRELLKTSRIESSGEVQEVGVSGDLGLHLREPESPRHASRRPRQDPRRAPDPRCRSGVARPMDDGC
jgi:hypothetical protein